MINKTETPTRELRFNSADYPLSQFVAYDGEEVIAAPDVPTEAEMRVAAFKYMGSEALHGAAQAAVATAGYIGRVITRS